jgi:glycosyltransferase involved in cell wall biosynthesis
VQPRVSVIVTVLDRRRHIGPALASLQAQEERAFEIIVVDDASSDGTEEILARAAAGDRRMVLLRNEENLGPFASANRALGVARGEFIARMDSDDLSAPERLSRQLAFFDAHPEVGLLGSACWLQSEHGVPLGCRRRPASHTAIVWENLLFNPFTHSSVMLRRRLFDQGDARYDGSLRIGGDYELWSRLLPVTGSANLEEPLITYAITPDGITQSRRREQIAVHDRVALRNVRAWLPELTLNEVDLRDLRALLEERLKVDASRRDYLVGRYHALFGAFASLFADAADLEAVGATVAARARELEQQVA